MHTGTFPSIAITSSLYGSPLLITLSKSNYNPETKCKFVPCQHSTPVPKGASSSQECDRKHACSVLLLHFVITQCTMFLHLLGKHVTLLLPLVAYILGILDTLFGQKYWATSLNSGAFCHSYVKTKLVAMQSAYTYIYERISHSEEYTEFCCYRMPLLQLLLQSGMASQPESTT